MKLTAENEIKWNSEHPANVAVAKEIVTRGLAHAGTTLEDFRKTALVGMNVRLGRVRREAVLHAIQELAIMRF